MSPIFIRSPGELLAIASDAQIGVPRFAEGNFSLLPKMTQVTCRHLQDLACLITPQPLRVVGIRLRNLRIIHGIFLVGFQSRHNMSLPETSASYSRNRQGHRARAVLLYWVKIELLNKTDFSVIQNCNYSVG